MAALTLAYPNVVSSSSLMLVLHSYDRVPKFIYYCDDQVRKETLLPSELSLFQNNSSRYLFLQMKIIELTYQKKIIELRLVIEG